MPSHLATALFLCPCVVFPQRFIRRAAGGIVSPELAQDYCPGHMHTESNCAPVAPALAELSRSRTGLVASTVISCNYRRHICFATYPPAGRHPCDLHPGLGQSPPGPHLKAIHASVSVMPLAAGFNTVLFSKAPAAPGSNRFLLSPLLGKYKISSRCRLAERTPKADSGGLTLASRLVPLPLGAGSGSRTLHPRLTKSLLCQ